MTKTKEDFERILADCAYPEYEFKITQEGTRLFLHAEYTEPDVVTSEPMLQKTAKYRLSPWMTKSEITQRAFYIILSSHEHRVREHFTYKNQRVYGPHFDVEALVELCQQGRTDERPDWYAEGREEDKRGETEQETLRNHQEFLKGERERFAQGIQLIKQVERELNA